jgi:hypothetical protein
MKISSLKTRAKEVRIIAVIFLLEIIAKHFIVEQGDRIVN